MEKREVTESAFIAIVDEEWLIQEAERAHTEHDDDRPFDLWQYRFNMGREAVVLDYIEYRILTFLSARPYHAHTHEEIVKAVTSERCPVSVETLPQHVISLRGKLGVFRDYVQRVPYIGYRFKA